MFAAGDRATDFETVTAKGRRVALSGLLTKGPVVLVFLRYVGCPLCRMHLEELQRETRNVSESGYQLLVVLESSSENILKYWEKKKLSLEVLPDIKRNLFDQFDVGPTKVTKALRPAVLAAMVKATLRGHFHGAFEGSEFQPPALFVIGADGVLIYAHYGSHPADLPGVASVLAQIGPGKSK